MDILSAMVEVQLKQPDDFLKVRETLTRIGIASKNNKTLYQSCHILHKRGRYYIPHFKELFLLDGKEANITEDDIARRNTIANLLAQWGLVVLVDPQKSADPVMLVNQIKIIPFAEKNEWTLVQKYSLGKKRD
jgi:hypothetical protein